MFTEGLQFDPGLNHIFPIYTFFFLILISSPLKTLRMAKFIEKLASWFPIVISCEARKTNKQKRAWLGIEPRTSSIFDTQRKNHATRPSGQLLFRGWLGALWISGSADHWWLLIIPDSACQEHNKQKRRRRLKFSYTVNIVSFYFAYDERIGYGWRERRGVAGWMGGLRRGNACSNV